MKFNFFKETTANYIAVNSDGFELDGKQYEQLECSIKQITPVRKLFKGKKIECYSNDAERGKNGEYCTMCAKRMNCRQRIRLMLLLNTGTEEQIPALLEINSNSFTALKEMLEPLKQEELADLLIVITVEKQKKYLQIQFKTLF
jgi:hypothetical protein